MPPCQQFSSDTWGSYSQEGSLKLGLLLSNSLLILMQYSSALRDVYSSTCLLNWEKQSLNTTDLNSQCIERCSLQVYVMHGFNESFSAKNATTRVAECLWHKLLRYNFCLEQTVSQSDWQPDSQANRHLFVAITLTTYNLQPLLQT